MVARQLWPWVAYMCSSYKMQLPFSILGWETAHYTAITTQNDRNTGLCIPSPSCAPSATNQRDLGGKIGVQGYGGITAGK